MVCLQNRHRPKFIRPLFFQMTCHQNPILRRKPSEGFYFGGASTFHARLQSHALTPFLSF
jgi:hypothetical protein